MKLRRRVIADGLVRLTPVAPFEVDGIVYTPPEVELVQYIDAHHERRRALGYGDPEPVYSPPRRGTSRAMFDVIADHRCTPDLPGDSCARRWYPTTADE